MAGQHNLLNNKSLSIRGRVFRVQIEIQMEISRGDIKVIVGSIWLESALFIKLEYQCTGVGARVQKKYNRGDRH